MAVQKSKKSKARTRTRRSHHHRKNGAMGHNPCPRCGERKLPHRVCTYCGHYRDEEIIQMDNF